ncbi:putative NLR family CARD domain-containing protein 4 [Apostichopus japonicus]|uniref:Putative NLR family CARD domain-containing protein 4 n=1 Tax=Stichopus japonicus TaxID=307972 RepID=A0A2G8JHM7_STIJA|nr:putative NLR family CARD domain-containing protein 4 [Apostichopus japonicus]
MNIGEFNAAIMKYIYNIISYGIKLLKVKGLPSFGSFKVALADVLTVTTVLQLATFFEYPPVIIEELGTAASAGLLMIRYMEERGQIQPTSILTLLSALKKMCLSGTGDRVKKLYEEHTGRLCSSDGQSKAQNEEGDPGYGKSTLTLQAAYDWCLGNVALPLKTVAVFILLPLRLLGNISSIFEAIRLVLMPPESPLTDDDILEILRHSLSVVIVLDGYDEYPDRNSVKETDVMKMIAGKMFPNVKVVVSTRSSSLPTYLHSTTVTIRLTGFDEKSRDEYIKRTVTGGDQEASRRITNALNSSPILNDICQVPMFCVLFAHVANDQRGVIEFSSVTSFFKYVIDCFYSHMWRERS